MCDLTSPRKAKYMSGIKNLQLKIQVCTKNHLYYYASNMNHSKEYFNIVAGRLLCKSLGLVRILFCF